VLSQLSDIRETKLGRDLSNDFKELVNFKNWLDHKVSILKTFRYDLVELKKVTNDKIRLLQDLSYRS
jgi:hypothetical protein